MKGKRLSFCSLVILAFFLVGCWLLNTPQAPQPDDGSTPTTTGLENDDLGLSEAEVATLCSLEQIDEYPLYTMHYYGSYDSTANLQYHPLERVNTTDYWACSLFAALGNPDSMLYGRNFDWENSPALFLYANPPAGYASVSMVDIAFLGFRGERAQNLTDVSLDKIVDLLRAPYFPIDGFNEAGLVVGMAAVPPGDMKTESQKPTIGSLGIIRAVLDQAATAEEAVNIMTGYNIDFTGGPPVHYLIADRHGDAILIEYYQGEMHVLGNQKPWNQATNFLRSSYNDNGEGHCWRYDSIYQTLSDSKGWLTPLDAVDTLDSVSQDSTQWSIVYNISSGDVYIAMGRDYLNVHVLNLELAD